MENFFRNYRERKNKSNITFIEDLEIDFKDNIFTHSNKDEKIKRHITIPVKKNRLNDFDGNIFKNENDLSEKEVENLEKNMQEIEDFLNQNNDNIWLSFLHKFFPKIYKSKLIKNIALKVNALEKMAVELNKKQIPYGEQDLYYKNLTDYFNYISTVHQKLKNKIKE